MLTRHGACFDTDDPRTKQARRELLVAPIDRSGIGHPTYFQVWWMHGTKLVVPKFYASEKFGALPRAEDFGTADSINVPFNGSLRADLDQPKAMAAVMTSLRETGGAVLSLGTGQGKTCCACYAIAELGVKTVVLVHKDVLRTQWAERIAQFLPRAKVTFVQGTICDTSGDIVIAMIQTLVSPGRAPVDWSGVGFVTVDECFPYRQMIMTENGPMTIGKIYKYWKQGARIRVQSFNEKTMAFELRDVTYAWEKQSTELVKVSYSKSSYRATSNHPVLTTGGWKATGDIVPGDLLISRYTLGLDEQAVALAMNSDQYQVFLGSLLGDGHLHNLPSQRYRLKVTHGPKQLEYIEWKAGIFGAKTRSFVGGYLNDTEYQFCTRVIDLPSHKTFQSHKTHCPQWVLDELDERGLAIWIMDDASLSRTGAMCIHTNTFDEDSQRRMCLKLGSMGIDATYRTTNKKDGRSFFYITLSTSSGRIAARLIAPYIHPSMAYKVINPRALISAETVGTHVWNRAFLDYGTLRVGSTEKYVPLDPRVYDLEVQGTHTFVCASISGNGPVVHNCHHVAAETFCKALRGLCVPYTLGLTATPTRKDGLTRLIHWFLGPMAYAAQRDEMRHVTVEMVRYTCARYSDPPPQTRFGTVNFAAVLTDMADDIQRTNMIVKQILKLREDPDRIVLVLSHRRDHCTDIAAKVPGAVAFLGGAKTKKSTAHQTAPVVCATYALASEGYDDSRLNALVLATPCSDVTQAAGRILRGASSKNPIILDIQDDFSVAYAQAAKRKSYYRKAGFVYATEIKKTYPRCMIID